MRAFSPYSFRPSSKAMVLARNMPMTNFAPYLISLRRNAMKVAPVVSTSSTSKTHFPLNRSGWNSRLAVRSPFRACLVLRPVISDGYRPVPVGYSHIRRELAAERLVPGAVLLPCGCRDGNQHGTVPVLLNRPDAAGGDGEELDERSVCSPLLKRQTAFDTFFPSKVILSFRRTGQ